MSGPYKTSTGLGDKGAEASRMAAELAAPKASDLRAKALDLIQSAGARGMTADEVAARLNLSPFSVRPRVSELAVQNKIQESKAKRTSSNGRPSTVWTAKGGAHGA